MDTDEAAKSSPRADATTVLNKFMVGYQGWSSCPDDRQSSRSSSGWKHWFSGDPSDGGYPVFDFWPDTSDYDDSELYSVPSISPNRLRDGASGKLFSSSHPATVERHFRMLAAHRIDGVFLQRWANQCLVPESISGHPPNTASYLTPIANERDAVLNHVRRAAEQSERVWAVMYDLTAMEPAHIADTILSDWHHLLKDENILGSTSYLRHQGSPVLALGGVGFAMSEQIPSMIRWLIGQLRARTPGGLWVMLGVCTAWRTGGGDQDSSPGWQEVFASADAICPWTVRRYRDEDDADSFYESVVAEDVRFLQNENIRLVPTVFPGFSLGNALRSDEFNEIPRQGGKFLWRQLDNAQRLNPPMIYAAMFDEFESGTALMPTVAKSDFLPRSQFKFLSLDVDGPSDLPSDWYLRICGLASCALKDRDHFEEDLPRKKLLVDYWHTRPKKPVTTDESAAGPSSSLLDAQGNPRQAFATITEQDDGELPPPPYSLELSDVNPASAVASSVPRASHAEPVSASSTSEAGSVSLAPLTSAFGSVSLLAEPTSAVPLRTSSPPANTLGQNSEQSNSGSEPGHVTPAGSWSDSATLNSTRIQQPITTTWPQDGHPHPSHANTLASTTVPTWPTVSVPFHGLPSTNVTPPTPGTAHPQDVTHSLYYPHHANTLPPNPQATSNSTWAQHQPPSVSGAPGAGGTYSSWQQTTPNAYPNQSANASPAAVGQARPVGESASYYENHPNLPSSPSPTPTPATAAALAPSTQSTHPVPHHSNSWGPGYSQYAAHHQQSQPSGYPGQGPGSPLPAPYPPPQLQPTASTSPHAPHHAYTIGPGATAATSPAPQPQQTWNTSYSAPAQTPTTDSYFAQQQYLANAPGLPPRPVGGTPPTSPPPASSYTPSPQSQASYSQASSSSPEPAQPTIIPQAGMKILTSLNPDIAKKAENALKMGGQFYNRFAKR